MLKKIHDFIRAFRIGIRIVSVLLLIFGIAILSANQSSRTSSIAENLIEVEEVLPENEGKLVIISGTPTLEQGGLIRDEEAGLEIDNAISYERVPFQLVYVKKTEVIVHKGKDKISTADDRKEYRDYIGTEWIIASEERKEKITDMLKKYENPPALDMSSYYAFSDLCLGEFLISPSDISGYFKTEKGGFAQEELEEKCSEYIQSTGLDLRAVDDEGLGYAKLVNMDLTENTAKVGDVKVLISYETFESAEEITVIGRQSEGRIVFDEEDGVDEGEHVRKGILSRKEYLDLITTEDAESRKIGTGFVIAALIAIISTLSWKIFRRENE